MPHCVVPKCRSNYKKPYITCFQFPKDPFRQAEWIKAIPRRNFKITKQTVVCANHFDESVLLKIDVLKQKDGTKIEMPRLKWALKKDAIPTIFESKSNVCKIIKQINPVEPKNNEISIIITDKILNVNDIPLRTDKYDLKNFKIINSMDEICFILVDVIKIPKISISFIIDKELTVQIFRGDINLNVNQFAAILGKDSKCNTYHQLNQLILKLSNLPYDNVLETERIHHITEKLKELIILKDSEKEKTTALSFLLDQIQLICAKKIKYSTDHLIFSVYLHYAFPNAYTFLREANYLIFPTPRHIKTLNIVKLNAGSVHSKYLMDKLTTLQHHEKYVNLLLHDFYIKKENEIDGITFNHIGYNEKSIFQVLMIASIASTNTDFLGYYTAKNFEIDNFNQVIQNLLRILDNAGYEVVSIISDNNEHNRKIYAKLSGTTDYSLQPYITSPFAKDKKIFLLFDTVELLKHIRNNWLDDKSQTFNFPAITNITSTNRNSNSIKYAKLSDLKYIHRKEENVNVKYASKLLRKTLYPAPSERLNFQLVLDIFDDTSIEALKHYDMELNSESLDTADFIDIIKKWWSIINVNKEIEHSNNLNDGNELALPIWDLNQQNVLFLKSFVQWLQDWTDLGYTDVFNSSEGKLHTTTSKALKHTTNSFNSLIEYMLHTLNFKCVLLGKFQLKYQNLK